MPEVAPPRRILTMDDIQLGLSDLARDGDGAQKAQAYRLLLSLGQTDTILPEPMNDEEREDRLARLMRGAGVASTRRAYIRAFPKRPSMARIMDQIGDMAIDVGIPIEKWPKTLRQLYKLMPDLSQPGFPKGYPLKGSKTERHDFVRKLYYKELVGQMKPDMKDSMIELEVGTDMADQLVARDDEDDDDVRGQSGGAARKAEAALGKP